MSVVRTRRRNDSEYMDDSEITAADSAGLLAAYDKYAASLYGYCRGLLGEPAPAADALLSTFEVAAAGLGGLTDEGEARARLYATARAECHRLRPAEANVVVSSASVAGLRSEEQEAIELTLRHGLSEADLVAVLGMSGAKARGVAARARRRKVTPGLPPMNALPPELREELLRRAAVGAARPSGEGIVSRARSAGRTGIERLGKLAGWSRIRAKPWAATAVAAAVWAVAAICATLITVISLHGGRAVATPLHKDKPAAANPDPYGPASPSAMASPAPSPRPASAPAHAGVVPTTARNPSPTQRTVPAPSPSPSARPSQSASPSPSPSPSPSSPSPSATPSSP
jgi:DNA-directed RNA polymerase specialized sigma24 family protein